MGELQPKFASCFGFDGTTFLLMCTNTAYKDPNSEFLCKVYRLSVSNVLFSTPAVTLLVVRTFGVKQQTCWGCRERCESLCVKRWWLMLSCTFLHPSSLPSYVPQCSGPQYVISVPLWTKASNVIQAMTVNNQVSQGGRSPSEPKARGGQYNKKCKITQAWTLSVSHGFQGLLQLWLACSSTFWSLWQLLPGLQQELVRSFGACSSCRKPLQLWRAVFMR